jgi:hypothetical protein
MNFNLLQKEEENETIKIFEFGKNLDLQNKTFYLLRSH